MRKTNCLTRDDAIAFLLGRATIGQLDNWAEHLPHCSRCQKLTEKYDRVRDGLLCELLHLEPPIPSTVPAEWLSRAMPDGCVGLSQAFSSQPLDAMEGTQESNDAEQLQTAAPPGYEVGNLIGKGGFGTAHVVFHPATGRFGALKTPLPKRRHDGRVLARLERESRVLRRLDHPSIVKCIESGHLADETPFLIMEYLAGDTLSTLIRHSGPLSLRDACRIVCEILDVLEYASVNGVVHRDIAPKNVFVLPDDSIRVVDWGLAKLHGDVGSPDDRQLSTSTGEFWGTVAYAAPEQLSDFSRCDCRADIYSAGWTLAHLLTAAKPGKPILSSIHAVTVGQDEVPLLALRPDLPPDFVSALKQMLRLDRSERPETPAVAKALLHPFSESNTAPPRFKRAGSAEVVDTEEDPTIVAQSLVADADSLLGSSHDVHVASLYRCAVNACISLTERKPLRLGVVGAPGVGKTEFIRLLVPELSGVDWQTQRCRLTSLRYARTTESWLTLSDVDRRGPMNVHELSAFANSHNSMYCHAELRLPADFLSRNVDIVEGRCPSTPDTPLWADADEVFSSCDAIVCCVSPDLALPSQRLLSRMLKDWGHDWVTWVVTRMDTVRRDTERRKLISHGRSQFTGMTAFGPTGVWFVSSTDGGTIFANDGQTERSSILIDHLMTLASPHNVVVRAIRPLTLLRAALLSALANSDDVEPLRTMLNTVESHLATICPTVIA